MRDTPEEAEYRARLRADLEKLSFDKEREERKRQIKAEEEARMNRKPLAEQAVSFIKEQIFGPKKGK